MNNIFCNNSSFFNSQRMMWRYVAKAKMLSTGKSVEGGESSE